MLAAAAAVLPPGHSAVVAGRAALNPPPPVKGQGDPAGPVPLGTIVFGESGFRGPVSFLCVAPDPKCTFPKTGVFGAT